MNRILLVDGHSMINRAFYGVPTLTNSKGEYTNAVYGFINILLSVIEDEKPDHLMVAFDTSAPTFRHGIYEAYKGTRKPMPEELRAQVPLVKDLLTAMEIPIISMEGLEADDLIGTMAKKAEAAGFEVCILSGDRDLLQLATDRTKIRLPHTKDKKSVTDSFYAKDVLEKYKVTPLGIIELKALMGDSSDNIPGVPKVGEKTATELIGQYGTIENLKEHREEITKKALKQTLMDNFELAELSKVLATINTTADIPYEPEDAVMKNIFTPAAFEIVRSLELKSLYRKFEVTDTPTSTPVKKACKVTEIVAFDDIKTVTEAMAAHKGLSCVSMVTDKNGEVVSLGLCMNEEEAYRIPLTALFIISPEYKLICDLLDDENVTVAAWSLKPLLKYFDIKRRKGLYDVSIMEYLLNPLSGDYMPDSKDAGEIARETLTKYTSYLERLKEEGMESLYMDMEMPLVFTLNEMEKTGVLVRRDELEQYAASLKVGIDRLEKAIYEKAGEEFNINSPKQLGVILFEKMALEGGKKTKTGYSTAADVLEKLAPNNPIVADILEYRALSKLYSTYAVGLLDYIDSDGRIHTSFNQTVTATGRISSSDPNLQNIPVRTEQGKQLRKVFVPKEGCVFIDADYSQIELRILACMSGDEKLIEAYNQQQDIHALTASQVFHVPFDEVTPQMRRNAKAVNFGIVYGISSFGLSQDLSITRSEAAEYIEKYFATYPGVKSFLDELVKNAKEKGYVTTMYGRKRPVPELKSGNFMQRQFGERVAMNAPIQGTAADIMKMAMINVERELKNNGLKSQVLLQVHDELLVEVPEEEKEITVDIIRKEMTRVIDLPVSLEVDINIGCNWYETH
ncbi:MAG: DNA polymerase I [Lachnospiraceae bacterium]|nr:DNA polymerase I [Lachnospiraceae bacterium]